MLPGYRSSDAAVAGHAPGMMAVTWGELMPVTWNFLAAYCDEAYAILSPDWISTMGQSVLGLNLAALKADLTLVTA